VRFSRKCQNPLKIEDKIGRYTGMYQYCCEDAYDPGAIAVYIFLDM